MAVLYGTNTFHLPHKTLMHISRFIRPAHLAHIRRLEVALDTQYLHLGSESDLVVTPGLALHGVLASCEDVQRLVIGVRNCDWSMRGLMSPVDITSVLREMDNVLMALPKVQGISVAFPHLNMKKLAGEADVRNEDLPHGTTYQLWRSLDKGDDAKLVEWRCCSYPKHANPLHTRAGQLTEDEGRGYWIFRGEAPITQHV